MPDCVVCSKSRLPKQLHTFTSKARLREQWMTALTNDDSEKARLDITLRTAKARQLVCEDHFAEESFDITPNSRVLKVNAIPMSKVQLFISNSLYHTNKLSTISTIRPSFQRVSPTVIYRTPTPTVGNSPPPTPSPSASFPLLSSTPVARPRPPPLPSLRLAVAPIPPCCRCCCKQETVSYTFHTFRNIIYFYFHSLLLLDLSMFQPTEMKKDANWKPPSPTTHNLPESKYLIVSKDSLVRLLKRCNSCPSGQNNLEFTENGHALTCKCTCTTCGVVFNWSNSDVLKTANASPKEQLKEINIDMCVGSAVTAVGTAVRK